MPPGVLIELLSLQLAPAAQSLHPTPLAEIIPTPTLEHFPDAPDLPSHPATLNFTVLIDGQTERTHKISLYYDVNFVTAHPCAPSHRVRFMKSPSSPTIREVDASGTNTLGSGSRSVYRAGMSPIPIEFLCASCASCPSSSSLTPQATRYTKPTTTKSSTSASSSRRSTAPSPTF